MTEAWPGDLPQRFQVSSFQQGLGDNRVVDNVDTGPPLSRPRASSAPDPVTGTMVMTRTQIGSLKTFVKTTLAQGSLPFTFPAQTEAGTWLVKFPKENGMPTWTALGGDNYSVTLSLIILP